MVALIDSAHGVHSFLLELVDFGRGSVFLKFRRFQPLLCS